MTTVYNHLVKVYPVIGSLSHTGVTSYNEMPATRANINRQTMLMCGGYPYSYGDDYKLQMRYGYIDEDATFTGIDLTDVGLLMTIYDPITRVSEITRSVTDATITIEDESGGGEGGPTNAGLFTITFLDTDLIDPGIYSYKIQMTKSTLITTIISGQFESVAYGNI